VKKNFVGTKILMLLFFFSMFRNEAQAEFLRETSAPVKPSWIAAPTPDSREFRYFVGIRTGASTLEEGKDSAFKNALDKIASFLNTRVNSEFEETTTLREQNVKQKIVAVSSAVVSAAKLDALYYEKTSRVDRDFRAERYDVYVLVAYPKEEVAREMERQSSDRRAAVRRALEWYRKGTKEEKGKRYAEARESYTRVVKELNGLDEATPVEDGFVDNFGLLVAAKGKVADLTRRSRRLAIQCRVRGREELQRQFVSSFTAAIVSGNLDVGNDDPAFEIRGEVSVSEGGYVMGNHVAHATGSLEVRHAASRRILSVVPIEAKGFHRLKEMAAMNALKESGEQAGELVVKAILDEEAIQQK
jgi:hypothetical protein